MNDSDSLGQLLLWARIHIPKGSPPCTAPITSKGLVYHMKKADFFEREMLGNTMQINTRKSKLVQFFLTPNLQRLNSFPL